MKVAGRRGEDERWRALTRRRSGSERIKGWWMSIGSTPGGRDGRNGNGEEGSVLALE